ncbi:SMI1/KNR4 family protein [Macrococcus capreoli]
MTSSKYKKFIKKVKERISLIDIERFETWRGYKLPEEFIEFSLEYPGSYIVGSFDADGRPDSMISNMLRFSNEGYSSIYVDEAYDIKDFGPYVLFGEDPGGNYIAFDYSKDELNPSVVFIDHEELGVLELPEGMSENDFTEEELDRLMSSEKLEDFPWAIHYVAESFTEFLNLIKFTDTSNNKINEISDKDIQKLVKIFDVQLPKFFISFMKKYSNFEINAYEKILFNHRVNLMSILSAKEQESEFIKKVIEKRGGFDNFPNLVPFIYINYNCNVYDFSLICLQKKIIIGQL